MLKQRTHARNRVNKGPTRMTILSYLLPGKENELKILRDLLPWKKSRVENSVTLNEVNDKLQLNVTKRYVSITFEQQEIVHIRTFYDYSGEIQYIGYNCQCQIPAHAIIYDSDSLSYFMRNVLFKSSNPLLTRLMCWCSCDIWHT